MRRTVTVQPCDFLFTSIFKLLFNNFKGDDETPKFLISDVYLKVNKPWDKLHDWKHFTIIKFEVHWLGGRNEKTEAHDQVFNKIKSDFHWNCEKATGFAAYLYQCSSIFFCSPTYLSYKNDTCIAMPTSHNITSASHLSCCLIPSFSAFTTSCVKLYDAKQWHKNSHLISTTKHNSNQQVGYNLPTS